MHMQEKYDFWTSGDKNISESIVSLPAIRNAIETMPAAQLLRLQKFATWRMRSLGDRTAGRGPEDLLSEAITVTLTGQRVWKEGIDFCTHLMGAMRSISSSWREQLAHESRAVASRGTGISFIHRYSSTT
jgi:hypothetical protein